MMMNQRRYAYFGHVEVTVTGNGDEQGGCSSAVQVRDTFSAVNSAFALRDEAVLDYDFTHQHVFFITQSGAIYAFSLRERTLFKIGGGGSWKEVDCNAIGLRLEQQQQDGSMWAHWAEWDSVGDGMRSPPPPTAADSNSPLLACTMFAAYLITQDQTGSIIERIHPTAAAHPPHHLDTHIKKICAGNDHMLLLDSIGRVYSMGSGNHGELGHGDLESTTAPRLLEMLKESDLYVMDVAVGAWHSLALTNSGDAYAWGWNQCGQLGYSPNEFTIQPTPYPIDVEKRVVSIACKNNKTVLLHDDESRTHFGADAVTM